jgi:hypothetical protein
MSFRFYSSHFEYKEKAGDKQEEKELRRREESGRLGSGKGKTMESERFGVAYGAQKRSSSIWTELLLYLYWTKFCTCIGLNFGMCIGLNFDIVLG